MRALSRKRRSACCLNRSERRGIKFAATYIGEALGNPLGGLKRGSVYEGQLNLAVDVDLEKLTGLRNDRTYWYKSVPKKIWQEFLTVINADLSAGAFLNKKIKPFYDCIEIG